MSITNTEIGSGLPGAAEVEPPAAVLHAGGSTTSGLQPVPGHAEGCGAHDDYDCDCAPTVASAGGIGMGVTGNAILLLGYAGGCLLGAPDPLYAVEEADPRAGTLQVRRHGTDNIYRISVVQLEGIE